MNTVKPNPILVNLYNTHDTWPRQGAISALMRVRFWQRAWRQIGEDYANAA